MWDNFFSDDNIPSSAWMKFTNVWDLCKWTFVEKYKKEWDGIMPDQIVYVLTNANIGIWTIAADKSINNPKLEEVGRLNIWIKASNDYINSRLKNVEVWDIIGFAFVEQIAPKTKWMNPAKSIKVFKAGVDEHYLKNKDNISATDLDTIFE